MTGKKTIRELIIDVAIAVNDVNIDVSAKDVSYIISLFFQGMAESGPQIPRINAWLYMIADECDKMRDEE